MCSKGRRKNTGATEIQARYRDASEIKRSKTSMKMSRTQPNLLLPKPEM